MARKNSFTIIESLIALVVFSMIMISLNFSINILKHKLDDQYQLRFYRFINYLENPNHHLTINKIGANQITIEDRQTKKIFVLKLQNNQLRLIGNEGGMIPLIGDVESVHFAKEKGNLMVNIIHDGKNFQQTLLVNKK